jgi:hypothetical protein
MADTTNEDAPIFVQRTGLAPAAGLQLTRDSAGLERTVTVFGQPAWLVSRAHGARMVLGDAQMFTTSDSMPLPVVQIIPPRHASRDTVVGGQRLSAGDLLVVSLPAANHATGVAGEPGRPDITRATPGHLASGTEYTPRGRAGRSAAG